MSTWHCPHCLWNGTAPSMTDRSELVTVFKDDGFEQTVQRVHVPICPDCYSVVRHMTRADVRIEQISLRGMEAT